ncbi:MAG: hypothetical protein ACFNPX_06180, partial [Neisseria subflava]
ARGHPCRRQARQGRAVKLTPQTPRPIPNFTSFPGDSRRVLNLLRRQILRLRYQTTVKENLPILFAAFKFENPAINMRRGLRFKINSPASLPIPVIVRHLSTFANVP